MSRWTDEEPRELVTLWPANSASQNCQTVAPPALGDTREGSAVAPRGTVAARSSQAFRRQSAKAAAAGAETKDHGKGATTPRRRQPRDPAVPLSPLSPAARGGQRSYPDDQRDRN